MFFTSESFMANAFFVFIVFDCVIVRSSYLSYQVIAEKRNLKQYTLISFKENLELSLHDKDNFRQSWNKYGKIQTIEWNRLLKLPGPGILFNDPGDWLKSLP